MKLFAVSDAHGHASVLKRDLEAAGFGVGREDHLLVCCGDIFDRGGENRAMLAYLESIPNKVLLRGNHEDMLIRALDRGYITDTDIHNGTDITLCEFLGEDSIDKNGRIAPNPEAEAILRAYVDSTLPYFETEHYVFTHGWIPLGTKNGYSEVEPTWRSSSFPAFRDSRWIAWPKAYELGLTLSDKTIVCGHRASVYGVAFDRRRARDDTSPFFGKGMVAIDGATVVSGRVNVLVLEDALLPTERHTMRLDEIHFGRVAEGEKTVEMRLFDEKRRRIRPGDEIEFICREKPSERLRARVCGVYAYPDFEGLTEDFSSDVLGFSGKSADEICEYMEGLYSAENIRAYGTVAIAIRRI